MCKDIILTHLNEGLVDAILHYNFVCLCKPYSTN